MTLSSTQAVIDAYIFGQRSPRSSHCGRQAQAQRLAHPARSGRQSRIGPQKQPAYAQARDSCLRKRYHVPRRPSCSSTPPTAAVCTFFAVFSHLPPTNSTTHCYLQRQQHHHQAIVTAPAPRRYGLSRSLDPLISRKLHRSPLGPPSDTVAAPPSHPQSQRPTSSARAHQRYHSDRSLTRAPR